MAKAMLIMDMPSSCMGCNFLNCDIEANKDFCEAKEIRREIELEKYSKPTWCPLREYEEWKAGGYHWKYYNACIDEILWGGE